MSIPCESLLMKSIRLSNQSSSDVPKKHSNQHCKTRSAVALLEFSKGEVSLLGPQCDIIELL